MALAARLLGLAAACAALLTLGPTVNRASAQAEVCKADVYVANGRPRFTYFSKKKELEGKGSAMAEAIKTWELEVGDKYGERWKLWSRAKDTTFECVQAKGTIIGTQMNVSCTISGRPCALGVPKGDDAVADAGKETVRGKR